MSPNLPVVIERETPHRAGFGRVDRPVDAQADTDAQLVAIWAARSDSPNTRRT